MGPENEPAAAPSSRASGVPGFLPDTTADHRSRTPCRRECVGELGPLHLPFANQFGPHLSGIGMNIHRCSAGIWLSMRWIMATRNHVERTWSPVHFFILFYWDFEERCQRVWRGDLEVCHTLGHLVLTPSTAKCFSFVC
jgi:hypothetical protein